MDAQPLDIKALHALVDAALAPRDEGATQEGESLARALPLTLLNTKVFTVFAEVVAPYLAKPDFMQVFDDLRHHLYEGLDQGSPHQLYTQVIHCRKCTTVEGTPVLPVGNQLDPDLMVVHDLPHRGMLAEQTFDELLVEVGFAPDRVVHTSLVRCDPNAARASSDTERQNCSGYLLAEIQFLKPKLILLLGSQALQAFVGDDAAITQHRGTMFCLGPWFFLPTYALGYLNKKTTAREDFVVDIRTAHRLCYGGDV